jgi:hypothetical protein
MKMPFICRRSVEELEKLLEDAQTIIVSQNQEIQALHKLVAELSERKGIPTPASLPTGLQMFPLEIVTYIFSFLDGKDLMSARATCLWCREASNDDRLWEHLLREEFPTLVSNTMEATFPPMKRYNIAVRERRLRNNDLQFRPPPRVAPRVGLPGVLLMKKL